MGEPKFGRTAVSPVRQFGNLGKVIDVVPLGPGQWQAQCECGATERFPDVSAGWEWVLGHPCPPEPSRKVVDLTDPCQSRTD